MLALAGCGTPPPSRLLACGAGAVPVLSADGARRSMTFSVLTYNIEGLGWPARSGRAAQLAEIGRHLAALRAAGEAPDIVLFQEMFSGAAKKAVLASGYPAIASGPRRTDRAPASSDERLPGKASVKRGEIGVHFMGGGLAVASRYPITGLRSQPYGRRSCAGIDCLANKGIMMVRIAIPGLPTPADLYNTHMNSRGASKSPAARNLEAHDRQALEASRFIDVTHDDRYPVIFGGDFNMRRSQERWDNFTRYEPMTLVHKACSDGMFACDVRMSWDGDEPWMDTQDLQFFESGSDVSVAPIRVEAMFDGSANNPVLSDHDGFRVTYRMSWTSPAPPGPSCGEAP
jgi:endonuclease/exonuclease/phosphatase family metal-dependent hydrolase